MCCAYKRYKFLKALSFPSPRNWLMATVLLQYVPVPCAPPFRSSRTHILQFTLYIIQYNFRKAHAAHPPNLRPLKHTQIEFVQIGSYSRIYGFFLGSSAFPENLNNNEKASTQLCVALCVRAVWRIWKSITSIRCTNINEYKRKVASNRL